MRGSIECFGFCSSFNQCLDVIILWQSSFLVQQESNVSCKQFRTLGNTSLCCKKKLIVNIFTIIFSNSRIFSLTWPSVSKKTKFISKVSRKAMFEPFSRIVFNLVTTLDLNPIEVELVTCTKNNDINVHIKLCFL